MSKTSFLFTFVFTAGEGRSSSPVVAKIQEFN